ncbi:MAG: putative DNA binding domain-containing protein [Clostridiales bacterium]|nr:putative DNA binding domain-containing protein [Clostridiales bacterium]
MVEKELHDYIKLIQLRGCEEQTTEVKAAHYGCPEKLYDTISSFSNQDSGGTFIFGLDEKNGFVKVGVYDAQDLQKKVMEYCEQMTPVVRPVFTVCDEEEMVFVSAEIPPVDIADRPCFKTAKGRLRGSYVRVGDADKPMTEYEVYGYEAFRKKYRDDIRGIEGMSINALDPIKLDEYLSKKRKDRPNLAFLSLEQQYEFTNITRGNQITLAALLLFGIYPQAYFPQLSIIATCVPGLEIGDVDLYGNRFTDTKRIEGTLSDMLDDALTFVRKNMRTATKIERKTGARIDLPQYPMDAVREAVLNALVHRDYSFHTEGMPIQLIMYSDRMEIINPGGLYGRLTVDQLGYAQPDTRNPVLVTAMETLGKTENRYSGIPTIRYAMKTQSLPEPVFVDSRGDFKVVLYHKSEIVQEQTPVSLDKPLANVPDEKGLLAFCRTPRKRSEIIEYLGISSGQYALRRYLDPLIEAGVIRMTRPDTPRSPKQQYVTADIDRLSTR